MNHSSPPPELEGVEHRWVTTPGGIRIHVAEAGPKDGDPVMLVHGFPQHWYEWRHLIGPLAAAGHRVLVPDLRGAGWSDAPDDRYLKADMAEDLLAVLDDAGIASVKLAGHDWGGVVAFILMLRHPDRVSRYFGLNTAHPWMKLDLRMLRGAWRFWYQIPLMLPVLGARFIGMRSGRYLRLICTWVGAGYYWTPEEERAYVDCYANDHARAVAGSRWYRAFQVKEFFAWARGEYAGHRVSVPVRFLHGTGDPVITHVLLRGYETQTDDMTIEYVDGPGHWLPEQDPELALEHLRPFFAT